ncbi:MAG: glycosyltransferase family 2 protein [Flavobacteriales bacterium]|nr:glycosyltransferase family 2 protein [Flavobacteriales bacterium]
MEALDPMKVSVLMPVYNKAPFVREAVESVLHGTYTDIEVVAVDDASTDDSLAVLRAITDPRLRIVELKENSGPGGAANAGLDACRGEYIVRLDADDIAVPERIAMQVAFMDAHPEIGASGGRVRLFGSTDQVWRFPLDPDDCAAQLLFGVPVSQGASILRRSVIEAHGLRYDPAWPRVGEDWLFWCRLGAVSRMANMDQVLIEYRRGPQNISHGRDKLADHEVILREVFRFFSIELGDKELDLHLMCLRLFRHPPRPRQLRALRNWLVALVRQNQHSGPFPREAFERKVEAVWDGLFFPLADRSPRAAWAHMRLSGSWPKDRLRYLAGALFARNKSRA